MLDKRLFVCKSFALVRIDDSWVVEQTGGERPARRLSTIPAWLGRVLTVLSAWEVVDAANSVTLAQLSNVHPASISDCLEQLLRLGLLHEQVCLLEGERDTARARDYQFCSSSKRPDYTDPATIGNDIQEMNRWASEDAPPAAWKQHQRRDVIPLPVPGLAAATGSHAKLGSFLYLCHAVLADATIGALPRTLRAVPSHGASHPFDLTLKFPSEQGSGKEVSFAYDPGLHALVHIDGALVPKVRESPAKSAVRIGIHLSIERVQFRYRSSLAYQTIYLDLGHLIETMTYAAIASDSTLSIPEMPVVPFTDRSYPGELVAEAFWCSATGPLSARATSASVG